VVQLHASLTSALDGSEWQASLPGRFNSGMNLIGGWVGFRTGLDEVSDRESPFVATHENQTPVVKFGASSLF
jgi:hypothetical protein